MEGPQIHLYASTVFPPVIGRELEDVEGERASQAEAFVGSVLEAAEPVGKRLWLRFAGHPDDRLTLHCLMFGDVRRDRDRPGKRLTLRLWFPLEHGDKTRIDLYLGAAKRVPASQYHEEVADRDVMRPDADPAATLAEAAGHMPDRPIGDVLLDQEWFPGLGNVIRCEALFSAHIHPDRPAGSLTDAERTALGTHVLRVAGEFYEAVASRGDHAHPKRRVHKQKRCPTCDADLNKDKLGENARTCWWCEACQPAGG